MKENDMLSLHDALEQAQLKGDKAAEQDIRARMSALRNSTNYTRNPDENRSNRVVYVASLFGIFLVLPLLGHFIATAFGFNLGVFETVYRFDQQGNVIGEGARYNLLSIWYINLPLYIIATRARVINAGFNQWLTVLFILPLVNFVIWFWPAKKLNKSSQSDASEAGASA